MKFLSVVLSALLLIQTGPLFAMDAKMQMIDQISKDYSYDLDTQDLTLEELQLRSEELAERMLEENIKAKDVENYLLEQIKDKKIKSEFKQLTKIIKKQKISKDEAFKRYSGFFNKIKSQGAACGLPGMSRTEMNIVTGFTIGAYVGIFVVVYLILKSDD